MMDILDNKHIHGKNLRDYTAKQRGAKRESFNHLMEEYSLILSILVYTLFSRMFDLMQPPVVKHSIAVA